MRARSVILCTAILGCGGEPRTSILIAPPEAKSALVFVQSRSGIEMIAHDPEQGGPIPRPTAIENVGAVIVAFYSLSLPELGLESGPIIPSEASNARQVPPPNAGARRSELVGSALGPWEELNLLPVEITALKLPPIDLLRCAGAGGCFLGSSRGFCKLPCTSTVTPDAPIAPAPPSPPQMTPCPEGWIERDAECLAPALGQNTRCPEGSARFDRDCEPLGPACSAEFAADAPDTACFVDPDAALDVDCGTRAAPGRSLTRAINSGNTIALGRGTIRENITLPSDKQLLGSCAVESIIEGEVSVGGTNVAIARLRLRGALNIAVTANATARDMIIDGPGPLGIQVQGTLQGNRITIQDRVERGLDASGQVIIDGLRIEGTSTVAVQLSQTASADLSRVTLKSPGNGLAVDQDARLTADRVLIEGSAAEALVILGTSSATISNLVIDDSFRAIRSAGDATATLRKTRVTNSEGYAVIVTGRSSARIEDLIVRGQIRRDEFGGGALLVTDNATAELTRARVERSTAGALSFGGSSTSKLTDVDVADSVIVSRGGEGIEIFGAALEILRFRAQNVFNNGVSSERGSIRGSDLILSGVRHAPDFANGGSGLTFSNSSVQVSRISIEDVDLDGVRLGPGQTQLQDLAVKNSTFGIRTFDGGSLSASRVVVESSRERGISIESGSSLEAMDLRIGPTVANARAPGEGRLPALNIDRTSSAIVRELSITSFEIGIELNGGSVELSRGVISSNRIGIRCVNPEDRAPELDRVSLLNNVEQNVACTR